MDILDNKGLLDFFALKACKLIRDEENMRGRIKEYSSGNLRLLTSIDGGVFEFTISSKFQPDIRLPVGVVRDNLFVNDLGSSNLNLEQSITFLTENWETLQKKFGRFHFKQTYRQLAVS